MELQWLEKTIIANSFKDKLIDLGHQDYVSHIEKDAKKTIQLMREKQLKEK